MDTSLIHHLSGEKEWLTFLKNPSHQVDLEPYIAPYLLTGLCDENEALAAPVRVGKINEGRDFDLWL